MALSKRMNMEGLQKTKGRKQRVIDHAKIAIISQVITSYSENKTARRLRSNTGLPELFNISPEEITRQHLYYATTRLYLK